MCQPNDKPEQEPKEPEPKPKKPGFWSTLGRKIGESIGQAKFGQ